MSVKITQLFGHRTSGTVRYAFDARTTHEGSRWAAVRLYESDKHWSLTHRQSGNRIDSLLPNAPRTLRHALAYVAALDALDVDWSAFDALPVIRASGKPVGGFPKDRLPAPEVVEAMRQALALISAN